MEKRPIIVKSTEVLAITIPVQTADFNNIFDSESLNAEIQAEEKISGISIYELNLIKSSFMNSSTEENCGEESGRINEAAKPKIIPSKYLTQIFMHSIIAE